MESNDFAYRLKLFITTLKMNSSQFADRVGIARPSLSQILSRRNKKVSNNVVALIHNAYPALSVLWLLFGEGEMYDTPGIPCSNAGTVQLQGDETSSELSEEAMASSTEYAGETDPLSDTSSFAVAADEEPSPYPLVASGAESRAETEKSTNSGGFSFSNDREKSTNPSAGEKYSNLRGLTEPENPAQTRMNTMTPADLKILDLTRQIDKMRENPRKVTQITIYYDDSTFETFYPAQ